MEKLSDIQWDIPNNKWIDYKFKLKSSIKEIAGQEFQYMCEI